MYISKMKLICVLGICLLPAVSQASIISFHFTGRLTVHDPSGQIIFGGDGSGVGSTDPFGMQTPIQSTFTYDTATGVGSGDLIISPLTYLGLDTQFRDVSMNRIEGTNYVLGNMLVDFGTSIGLPLSLVWDASGLLNAVDYGLQAGDVISGTNLIRAGDPDYNVNSAVPASDGYTFGPFVINQGPAPLATTTLNTTALCTPGLDCIGNAMSGGLSFIDDGIAGSPQIDGPFPGMQVSLDIGSGNSLTVLSVSSVPVPAAVWLFGSGLIGFIAFARRKKTYAV